MDNEFLLGKLSADMQSVKDNVGEIFIKLDNIMESIINMTSVINGIDVWIDKDKVIHFGATKRGSDKSAQFGIEYGINTEEIRITDNFSSPANTAYAIGSNDGVEQQIVSYADTSARRTYLLREQTVSAIDVSEEDTLLGKSQDLVSKNRNQVRTVKVSQLPNKSPGLDKVFIGDQINVIVRKGRYNINSPFRILGYEAQIGEVGQISISWVLSDFQSQDIGVS